MKWILTTISFFFFASNLSLAKSVVTSPEGTWRGNITIAGNPYPVELDMTRFYGEYSTFAAKFTAPSGEVLHAGGSLSFYMQNFLPFYFGSRDPLLQDPSVCSSSLVLREGYEGSIVAEYVTKYLDPETGDCDYFGMGTKIGEGYLYRQGPSTWQGCDPTIFWIGEFDGTAYSCYNGDKVIVVHELYITQILINRSRLRTWEGVYHENFNEWYYQEYRAKCIVDDGYTCRGKISNDDLEKEYEIKVESVRP